MSRTNPAKNELFSESSARVYRGPKYKMSDVDTRLMMAKSIRRFFHFPIFYLARRIFFGQNIKRLDAKYSRKKIAENLSTGHRRRY